MPTAVQEIRKFDPECGSSKGLAIHVERKLEHGRRDEVLLRLVSYVEKTLWLVRHGQTDWNAEDRFQGQLDIPINAFGRSQAARAKTSLADVLFDTVYSSPLLRAFETARMIAGTAPINTDRRLSEIHHGVWQGLTKREIACYWPDDWKKSQEQSQFTPSGGEPCEHVRARVEDFLQSMQGNNILCVSHGVIIQMLLSILAGVRTDRVPPNASIHRLVFRNNTLCDYL